MNFPYNNIMNKLVFDKNMIIIEFCAQKCNEMENHWTYVLDWTKRSKRWGYYMAIRNRLLRECEEEIR